jgi:RNA polymerase sigma-70 factor (ECF subfamily)
MPASSRNRAQQAASETAADSELIRLALAGDREAIRSMMRKYNRRLFRIARSIVRDDTDAEDVLQNAYIRAFTHLREFRGDAALSTWLSRIVMNEALGHLRKPRECTVSLDALSTAGAELIVFPTDGGPNDPERAMAQREILRFVERAIDNLPEAFRTVLMARLVEGMSIEETAELLSIKPETVKTRLFRARELLREQIDKRIDPVLFDAFPFAGPRCERVVELVMRRLGLGA